MKIGLYGHYGQGEFCDDYIMMAIKNTFDNITDTKNEWVILPDNNIHNDLDLILLGGGSILGVDYNYNILKKTSIPFYIFSAGFRDSDTASVNRIKYLLNRCESAFVRGKLSKNKLDMLKVDTSKIDGHGDPIFLCKAKKRDDYKDKFIGGVYRPYITDSVTIKEIFDYLAKERDQKVKLFTFSKGQGDYSGGTGIGYKTVDFAIMRTYKEMIKCGFWLGNRLHPFSIALIHGIPTIGLDIEFDKVEDLCSAIDYDYFIKNDNLNIDTFRHMYIDVIKNHDRINKDVQIKIADVRNNLERFAKKIVDDVIDL